MSVELVSVNMDYHSNADKNDLSKSSKEVSEWYKTILKNGTT